MNDSTAVIIVIIIIPRTPRSFLGASNNVVTLYSVGFAIVRKVNVTSSFQTVFQRWEVSRWAQSKSQVIMASLSTHPTLKIKIYQLE